MCSVDGNPLVPLFSRNADCLDPMSNLQFPVRRALLECLVVDNPPGVASNVAIVVGDE